MSTIYFGWRLPAFPADDSRGATFIQQIHAAASVANEHFDSVWVADHFIPWATWQQPQVDTLECFTTMAYISGLCPRLHVGSIVMSNSYRPPALLAKMAATLQTLTGGRFILGIGAGWKQDEYLAYGYKFPSAAVRIRQLEEGVQVMRALWTQSPATFRGQYYQVVDAYCEPRPSPMIPILIGGGGEKLLLRVVAQHADWWNFPGGSLENYAHKLEVLKEHCRAIGRDYDTIVKTWAIETVAVARTEAEARRMAEASRFYDGEHGLIGVPDQVANQMRAFTRLGVTHFILRFADFPRREAMELFAQEVIPQFRGGNRS